MKRGYIVLFFLVLFGSTLFGQNRYDNQEYISRPKSENWFIYIDYSLAITADLNLKSQSTKDLVNTTATPFIASNNTDIELKENLLFLGVSWIILDKEEAGKYSLYGGLGTTNATVGIFPAGQMGISGIITKWGIEGDLWKFGRFMDKGISFDASIHGFISSGDGKSGIVKQDYDMFGYGIDIKGFFNAKASMADTSEALIYIGGRLFYTASQLTLDNKTAVWSGTGIYDLDNKLQNMLYLVLGSKIYWEKDRTTIDIQLSASLDRSYVIGVRLSQTF